MRKTFFYSIVAILGLIPLTACDLYEEGHITERRPVVQPQQFTEEIMLSDMNDDVIAGLAGDFLRSGDDTLELSVAYDPRSSRNGTVRAGNEVARIKRAFAAHGVNSIQGNVLPVQEQGDDMKVLVTFDNYVALPPEDCENMMQGFANRNLRLDEDYKLGCTVETVFTRQVAHPKDLLGETPIDPTTDGRRGANIIERQRSGAPSEDLGGESASDD